MLQRGKEREKVVVVISVFMTFITIVIQAWWPTHQLLQPGPCLDNPNSSSSPLSFFERGFFPQCTIPQLFGYSHFMTGSYLHEQNFCSQWPGLSLPSGACWNLAGLCDTGTHAGQMGNDGWGKLLLLSQQKVFSCDSVGWCPANLTPYLKST